MVEEEIEKIQYGIIKSPEEFKEHFSLSGDNYCDGSYYIIKTPLNISGKMRLLISDCIFEEPVYFAGTFSDSFEIHSCEFKQHVAFDRVNFECKARLQNIHFLGVASFDNTKFKDLCDFWSTTFYRRVIFYKTDFKNTIVFSRCVFKENVLFTYTLIEKQCILRGTRFRKGLDLSNALLTTGTINWFDTEFKDFDRSPEPLDENDYESMISVAGGIPERNKRETYRIIKKQLESQNNFIYSLKFTSEELKSYRRELYHDIRVNGLFKTEFSKVRDWLNLKANYHSNHYGQSWTVGFKFTMLGALFFFYLIIVSSETYEIGFDRSFKGTENALKLFFEFLNPTHKTDYLETIGASVWTYFLDFLGRIFIVYGFYQTVQAFRKFKN